MGSAKIHQENPVFGQKEIYDRYQRAQETLVCRVLAEPYNFRAVDAMIVPAMCEGGYYGDILKEAQKQFRDAGKYSPQSIGLALNCDTTALLKHSNRDAEIDLPTAFSLFEFIYGQWIELQIADTIRAQINNGSGTEEIRIQSDTIRREKGLGARVIQDDGRAEFEKELIAAIDCKSVIYPVRPPLKSLRESVPFFEPGEYAVVAARTGMGKSYFALNCNYQAALDNVPSCYINLENTPKNVQRRIWQMHTGVKWQREYPGIGQHQVGKMLEGWDWVKNCKLNSYTPSRTLSAVMNTIRKDYYEHGCQLAVVDYLQKIRESSFRGQRVDELAEISASLRQLATDLKIPIIVLAQINREAEKAANKRPTIADIRGSGDIEQDASMILLLYRPSHYEIDTDENGDLYPDGYADIFLAKGRDVAKSLIKCRFNEVAGFHDSDFFQSNRYESIPAAARPGINDDTPF